MNGAPLTGSGPEILTLCDGTRRGQGIASEIAARHVVDGGRSAHDDTHDFLASMRTLGVVELLPDEGDLA